MHHLDIDAGKRSGCGTCLEACNVNAIGWDEKPIMAYPEDCQACSVCERACPEGASVMVPEMFYRSSLERSESRGFHLREDFPDRDDVDWLKWVIVRKGGEEMVLRTEDVPVDDYPYRPSTGRRG